MATDSPPVPIVLDVDTGIDDAMAILFAAAHPGLDLRAVTCVAGNVPLPQVVHNTLSVLDHTDLPDDLPVAAGFPRPLLQRLETAAHVHGVSGVGGLELPASQRRHLYPGHAVDLLREVLESSSEPVTLVTLAPLTNVAVLLRLRPDLVAEKVRHVVSTVGSIAEGNVTAAAEFNAYGDPHAAAILFESGLPLTMYGWDVFRQVRLPADDVARLQESPHRDARLTASLLHGYQDVFQMDDPYVGDAGAVCAVVDPEALTCIKVPVYVELTGRSAGRTVVDTRPSFLDALADPTSPAPPRASVAIDIDAERYRKLFLHTLLRLPG